MTMIKKQTKILLLILLLLVLLVWIGYAKFASHTRIATLNFPDFTLEKMIRSNDNSFIKIESVGLDDAEKISKYDMVLVRIHGNSLNQTHLEAIKKAKESGVPVFSTESDNAEINTFSGRELEYITTLMENGATANYRSLFNYVRTKVDRKRFFLKPYNEPVVLPNEFYFYLGDDNIFDTYESYQTFYEESGKYKEDAPRVVLLSGNINMQNSNEEHMAALIEGLENNGLNVYPISSFGPKKLAFIKAVNPDLVVYRPHGRLVMGGREAGVELLKTLNVPLLAPITVNEEYDKWLEDKQGLAAGGMTSMSIVLPELDGAVAPYAVAALFDRDGKKLFDAIPQHTERFCAMVKNYVALRKKDNSEKRIAIYYYKGTGKGTINASGIEGVESLYNTLLLLKQKGYKVEGLPSNAKELEQMVQKQGSVLGAYALGAYDEFIRNGNPALVDVDLFNMWAQEELPEKLIADMKAYYGEAPGKYMGYQKDDKKYIAVARLQFGNVTILPQPMPSEGENIDKIIHGVEGAPAYPYVASYLWTRKSFRADALIHFGTHGSLEFIPGKQVALSPHDWSDALVGDLPHFYIYTISNIGEGIIAKRRSYAALVSHLTSPFMQADLYGGFGLLHNYIHKMEHLEEGNLKQNYRQTITQMAKKHNILSDLDIDSTLVVNDADIQRIHIYLAEVEQSKVIDGLYTLGEEYTGEQLGNTSRLMSIDPIRYALAQIDRVTGNITVEQMDDLVFMTKRYTAKTENITARAMRGEDPNTIMTSLLSSNNLELWRKHQKEEAEKQTQIRQMMAKRHSNQDTDKAKKTEEKEPFFDENGDFIEKPIVSEEKPKKELSVMDRMAQAEPVGLDDMTISDEKAKINALTMLYKAISQVKSMRDNLKVSTKLEQEALLNGLSGGYIHPGSAGDPIVNAQAIPTGKNFYSINPETTPTAEAWKVGKRLAESLLATEMQSKGKYPEKVSFTLWATDFISTEGAMIAQILYMLGVEPLRDGFGYIRSLRLIPESELGRPRIDVVVQTSGQLRDLAASRLSLINRAVDMAAEAKEATNFVRKGLEDAERRLLELGFSPADARKYSRERVFGGVNGNYGTGIMGLVEKGDSWESRTEIAEQYINNMSGLYSSNGNENWGEVREGVFEAALLNTSVVVQPRSSNTWGALSLDHVYEFMGGISAAIEHVTGEDPTGYFSDFRNANHARMQGLKEAIGVESNSTILNPKFITQMMKGEASAMEHFAEVFRNSYGWNAMKPSVIDQHLWNQYYEVYVKDKYQLNLHQTFEAKNPYALQEMTAIMLETARKGMWKASKEQIVTLSELHAELLEKHEAGCRGFICDNAKLKDFISKQLTPDEAAKYQKIIEVARNVELSDIEQDNSVILKKDEQQQKQAVAVEQNKEGVNSLLYISLGVLILLIVWLIVKRRKD